MKITHEITLTVSRQELRLMHEVISRNKPYERGGPAISSEDSKAWYALCQEIEEAMK